MAWISYKLWAYHSGLLSQHLVRAHKLAKRFGKAFDNILFSSRRFRYMLELNSFYAETDKRGSDHKAVVAQFLC